MSFANPPPKKITLEIVQRKKEDKRISALLIQRQFLLVKSKSHFPGCRKAASQSYCVHCRLCGNSHPAWEAVRCEPLSWLSCRLSSAFLPPPSHFDFLHFCPKPSLRMPQLQFQSSHQPSLPFFPECHLQTDVPQVYPRHSATAFGEVHFLTKNMNSSGSEVPRTWA